MAAVLEYTNRNGEKKERVWKVSEQSTFTALIKCYVQSREEKNIQIIEKPSTRPATFSECHRYAEKLKGEYGEDLKQIIVWNMDELSANWL